MSSVTNACDVKMLEPSQQAVDFVLDGVHFGRGDFYSDQTVQVKHNKIEVVCWQIVDNKLNQLDPDVLNHFYDGETYVIRWTYRTEVISGDKNQVQSGNNAIYFYWKGENAPKGFSPLPDDLEEDNPPVERIVQWAEPPVFLRLFSGSLVVHNGNHGNVHQNPRLYILRGDIEEEVHLYEVACKKESLRSRTSFVLVEPDYTAIIWHGAKTNTTSRSAIKLATHKVFGKNFSEVVEGSESFRFLELVEGKREDYYSADSSSPLKSTPKLFYFTDITGSFLPIEVEHPHRSSLISPLPFLQSHLYTATQPALFLLDDSENIWVWQGWVDKEDEAFEKQCILVENAAVEYARTKEGEHKVVYAGSEPLGFTNSFPVWSPKFS